MSDRSGCNEWVLPARARLPVVCLLAVWVLLAMRLVQLQWSDHPRFSESVARQRSTLETIPARPGDILDREGRLLATTVTARSLYIVPSRIDDPWEVARTLGDALGMDADGLFRKIGSHADRHFLWVRRRLPDDEADRVKSLNLPPGSWGFREEYLRRYPQGALAAHVLGLRNIDGEGRGGIEQSRDDVLRGRPGRRRLVRDARGHVIDVRDIVTEPPRPGRTVTLTLDVVVQLYAERELDRVMKEWKPRSATAIVIGVPECEILAMASRPAFDPNDPSGVPEAAWKNKAIAAIYEPGSTFKPFVVGWAIQTGKLAPEERFDCELGEYRMGRRVLHDHHPYGMLDVTDILVKSSNIGMAKIGERLTNRGLYDAAVAFGFGQPTGIALPGELAGILHPLDQWTSYSTGSVPMGQEIAATPLQVAAAHAALASGGTYRAPRLILTMEDGADSDSSRERPNTIAAKTVRPEVAEWLVAGPLREVVTRGTGRRAELDDYEVFGKSGTAQKFDPATGTYSDRLHTSSFVCGGPPDAPRAIVLVVVDEPSTPGPHYGGTIAAPPASRILRETLRRLHVSPRSRIETQARNHRARHLPLR